MVGSSNEFPTVKSGSSLSDDKWIFKFVLERRTVLHALMLSSFGPRNFAPMNPAAALVSNIGQERSVKLHSSRLSCSVRAVRTWPAIASPEPCMPFYSRAARLSAFCNLEFARTISNWEVIRDWLGMQSIAHFWNGRRG